MSSERPIVSAKANVLLYDNQTSSWVPSGPGIGISKVSLYQNPQTNAYRIVGWRLQDRSVAINCSVPRGLKYHQARPTFHQWRDSKQQVYGLNFITIEDANAFASAVQGALENLAAIHRELHETRAKPVDVPAAIIHSDVSQQGMPTGVYAGAGGPMNQTVNNNHSDIDNTGAYAVGVVSSSDHSRYNSSADEVVKHAHANSQNNSSHCNGSIVTPSKSSSSQAVAPPPPPPTSAPPAPPPVPPPAAPPCQSSSKSGMAPPAPPPPPPPPGPPPPAQQSTSASTVVGGGTDNGSHGGGDSHPAQPPPPPPPTASTNAMETAPPIADESVAEQGGLAAQLRMAKSNTMKTKPSGPSAEATMNPPAPKASATSASAGGGGGDMMSDLQRVLAARRKAKEQDISDIDSADGGGMISSATLGTRRTSCATTSGQMNGQVSSTFATLRKNSTVAAFISSGSSNFTNGSTTAQNCNNSDQTFITRSDLENFKRELVIEFKKEVQQMKAEVLEALRFSR